MTLTQEGFMKIMEAVSLDSKIVQDFHNGYWSDLNTANANTTITRKPVEFPVIVVSEPKGEALTGNDNIFPQNSNMRFDVTLFAPGYYQPDGKPNPNQTRASYVDMLRTSLYQVLRRVNQWSAILSFNQDARFGEADQAGKYVYWTIEVSVHMNTITFCDPLYMSSAITDADLDALAGTLTPPTALLSTQQKAVYDSI
jgi:hypothetical protein